MSTHLHHSLHLRLILWGNRSARATALFLTECLRESLKTFDLFVRGNGKVADGRGREQAKNNNVMLPSFLPPAFPALISNLDNKQRSLSLSLPGRQKRERIAWIRCSVFSD